jgi:beta-catenin-like protein 1
LRYSACFRYLDSETELDRSFSFLYPIPQDPLTYYPEIISNPLLIPNLIQLLSHENTDIALQVVSALYEMTDEDVGDDAVEREEEDEGKEEVGRKLRLIMGDFVGALVSPRKPGFRCQASEVWD